MRIAKVTGLQVSNVELIKFTNERENNMLDYDKLTNELLLAKQ